jgi:hypothetical protein
LPNSCRLYAERGRASFCDAFEADLTDASLSALEIALRYMRATPQWVEALLSVRNWAVAPLGLRDSGPMGGVSDKPAAAYAPGERLGVFTIRSIELDEVVLSADDRHAEVRVAFLARPRKDAPTYVIASWVRTRNTLGRLYMIPVAQIHPLVVKAGMRALAV